MQSIPCKLLLAESAGFSVPFSVPGPRADPALLYELRGGLASHDLDAGAFLKRVANDLPPRLGATRAWESVQAMQRTVRRLQPSVSRRVTNDHPGRMSEVSSMGSEPPAG
jgi:hypothetical protein